MNILFVTAQTLIPQMYGGLQRSSAELATNLIKSGHNVTMLGALDPKGYIGKRGRLLLKLLNKKAVKDRHQKFVTYRAWYPEQAISEVVTKEKPDVAVVLARQPVKMAKILQNHKIPVLLMLQDVEFEDHGGDFNELSNIKCVANSHFTAKVYKERFNVDSTVIYPMVDKSKYITETSRKYLTFINPHPKKGLDLVLRLAQSCNDIPFLIVEGWPLEENEKRSILTTLSNLPNVTFSESVDDIREIYSQTKLLIVPSRWEEAYGRVSSEVQFSGIPVIGSNKGGLPESIGNGGVLLDYEADITEWKNAVYKIWNDEKYYQELSIKAVEYANRDALNMELQFKAWNQAIVETAMKISYV